MLPIRGRAARCSTRASPPSRLDATRRKMSSALPFMLLALTLLCGCPSKPHTILTDQPQPPGNYRYAAVGVDSPLSQKIESMVPREELVLRHTDDGQLAYVVRET